MNILIITQSVDKNNSVLGFFQSWIYEFSKKVAKVTVICLEEGEHNLPSNVTVLSLGKEKSKSKNSRFKKLHFIINFYHYIFAKRREYDAVFVHMNQEYVLLGGLIWRILGKRILLWRNHPKGGLLTRIAVYLSNRVYCTSTNSFTARYSKTMIMPVGIDTGLFKPDNQISKIPNSILSIGRIAPIKNIHVLVSALGVLRDLGVDFVAHIYGGFSEVDKVYYERVVQMIVDLNLASSVSLLGPLKHDETIPEYLKHEVFVNLTEAGSFDKTILESMSCGLKVVTLNPMLKGHLNDTWIVHDLDVLSIANALRCAFTEHYLSSPFEYVDSNHSLKKLVDLVIGDIYK